MRVRAGVNTADHWWLQCNIIFYYMELEQNVRSNFWRS